MENEIVVASPQDLGISVARDPKAVIAEAYNAAKALKDIIEAKPADKKVMMGGEQYIEFDDWQMLAKFYGITAKVVSTEYVEIGGARGFNAKAVALHGPTGQEVSAAESMCLNDEDKWSTRPKYEWIDKKRTKVGDVPVPLFQLKSMAQTRACAKALRNILSGIVVLAGYRATVFEEMTGDEPEAQGSSRPPIQQPKLKEAAVEGEKKSGQVANVSQRTVKTKDGEKTVFEIMSTEGQKFETWEVALADKAVPVKGTETLVTFTYKNIPWTNKDGKSVNSYKLLALEIKAEQVGS